MMKDVLIVGQGICGTFLSWYLEKKGCSFVIIDEERPYTASRAAAGLINPVTGRRIVKTWMIDELLSFAEQAYQDIGGVLQLKALRPVDLIDFFPTAQMRLAFLERFKEDPQYLRLPEDEHAWDDTFRYAMGYGMINPCYIVDLPRLLPAARQRLESKRELFNERFDRSSLVLEADGVRYKDISARMAIFCDGIESVDHPWFSKLPFAPNKGEALVIDVPDLGTDMVFKKGMTLAPWKDGLYWVGSSYEWSFTDGEPTGEFRQRTEALLRDWLKIPFNVVEHIASIRPATLERRPFAGFHPVHSNIGILNGMGTKGCSLAPYFAHQLVEHIAGGGSIRPDADVKRFTKILTR